MSRIGKSPIVVPAAVKVDIKGKKVSVQGPKGKLDMELPRRTSLKVEGDKIVVSRDGEDAEAKAMHGLGRALINNMVLGLSVGFSKKLEINGCIHRNTTLFASQLDALKKRGVEVRNINLPVEIER